MLRYGHVELFVRDPAVARDFYRDVLGLRVDAEQGGGQFVWIDANGSPLLLRPAREVPSRAATYQSADQAIVLYTDDLDGSRAALESRGLVLAGTDGSPRCLTFTDPDGHWFQLVDPGDH